MVSMNRKIIGRTVDIAMALCPLNLEHRCSHIAFLIRCGKIVHIGTNSCKSHPETLKYDYKDHQKVGIHAELNVCMKSGKENLKDYSMVVLRVDRKEIWLIVSRVVVVRASSNSSILEKFGTVTQRAKW